MYILFLLLNIILSGVNNLEIFLYLKRINLIDV